MAKSSRFALTGLARRTPLAGLSLTLSLGVAAACGSGGSGNGSHFEPGTDASVDVYGPGDASTARPTGPRSLFGRRVARRLGQQRHEGLAFMPPSATISLTGTGSGSASFTLMATYLDGHTAEVQAQSVEFDRPDLATLTTAGDPVKLTASGPYAGVGHDEAVFGGKSATADLTVQVAITVIGKGVPPGAVKALGGSKLPADPSVTSLLYPYDKTVFALGLYLAARHVERAEHGRRLPPALLREELHLRRLLPRRDPPAQISADQTNWDRITASNGGDPLVATLGRWDATTREGLHVRDRGVDHRSGEPAAAPSTTGPP